MSTSPECEALARQDYGPTTPSDNVFEQVLDKQLIDNMNVQSIRTPVLRAVPISPNDGTTEPDSTDPEALISSQSKLEKDTEYEIVEKQSDTEMSVDTLSGIVRIEEATIDSAGRITYPIVQDTDEISETSFVESAGATLIQTPLNTAIVQNVTKLPQNFTINVDATVGNITAIQNVTQDVAGNQTLWLPTILATSAAPADNKSEEEIPPSGVSQIIITSESYVSDATQVGRRANIVTETSYVTNRPKTPKVQILSNIAVPKNAAFPQQFLTQSKDLGGNPVYATQNHVYKVGTNVLPQKHLNSTVLCSKTSKNQMLMSTLNTTIMNTTPIKNVTYSHTFTKSTNVKTINKINNGATNVASTGNTQCHILSRVVSGPNKLSVHSGRKTGTLKSSKGSGQATGQKNHSRAIKIIQQSGANHKSDKTWASGVSSIKTQTSSFDSNTSKIIQKVGSPPHKSQALMPVAKPQQKGERLILQSPCGPVLLTTAPSGPCVPKTPHYVQSGSTPNLRYVQTYGSPDAQISISQVSANQQLTAQILQSLSHPKLMLPPASNIIHHTLAPLHSEDLHEFNKQANRKRVVVGDKSTLITADDMVGREERPNLAEELQRYTFTSLAFVMRDHTYSLPAQKQPSPTTTSSTVAVCTPVISSPVENPTPISPVKRTSPVIMSTTSYDLPMAITPTSVIGPAIPVSSIAMAALQYKPQMPLPQEDDAASNISSVEGERRPDRGGSDTETAPEGEEEGKTRCICDFTHDDGYMICCDRCGEWQHVDCMGIDRNNIPDQYMCELCHPRPVDRRHARAIQLRKREELHALAGSDSDFSDGGRVPPGQRKKRLLTVTTYSNTSSAFSSTMFNSNPPVLPPVPLPTLATKRGPKRPKKSEALRKGNKRKLSEKKLKRKKEAMVKNKYSSNIMSPTHFQESFELAMTNHYSPELRAKMTKYTSKMGNTANMAAALTAHLCTTVPHAGGKILIATKDLRESVPIIELRGKYMLSNQHKPQMQNSARAGSQKPGPFVFFYQLPKDNTQICIDTRTYGNEARFVRRSCKPNAELQHCIVKGTLHVYLVTIAIIPADTEITVGHDSEGVKQQCACGNPRYCKLNGLSSIAGRKSIDYPMREKRLSRNRCASMSSPTSPPSFPALMSPVRDPIPPASPIKSEKKSPVKQELVSTPLSPPPKPEAVVALNFDEPMKAEISEIKSEIDLMAKEELKPEIDELDSVIKTEPLIEAKQNEIETIVPPKIEEEPEKQVEDVVPIEEVKSVLKEDKPVIQEAEEKEIYPIKEEDPELSDEEKPLKPVTRKSKEVEANVSEDRPVTREMAAKSAVHDRSTRTSRSAVCNPDSIDDKTDDSQEKLPSTNKKEEKKMTREERKMEAIMKAFERMEKAQQRKQEVKERQKRRESDPHPPGNEREEDEDAHCIKKRRRRKGRSRTTSQSNRRRLNSADSDMVTSGDEAPPTPRTPRRNNASTEGHSDMPSEEFGLSSACRLVEAAVGSVESAFKLPKTKKAMASEWVGRSPDRTPSPYRSPYRPSLVPATSLESLVRVASTMIGDLSGGQTDDDNAITSPPRTPGKDKGRTPKKLKKVTRSTPPVAEVAEIVPATVPQHSAKKRWLRQAISEESDSPSAESPPNEMVTPLKKRRLARESLSCEQNNVVPCNEEASPRLTSDDSPVKDDSTRHVRNIMENIYARDRTQSDSGQGSDDQNMDNDVLNVNLKVPHDSEKIRRIIGIPTPEEELPPLPKSDPENTNNNSIQPEESSYNKVVPMDIDNTVTAQPKIESNENSCEMKVDSPIVIQSAETSGNSSPQRDEMDDIQKKIHSFHTENILMLKSRNKKPKEKRKKVNLNFDLNMVDDQISIQLRKDEATSPDVNGDIVHVSPENIPLPPVETIPLPAPENIPLPEEPNLPLIPPPEAIPLPDEAIEPVTPKPVSPPHCLKLAAEKSEGIVTMKEPMVTRSFTLRSEKESIAKAAALAAKPLNFKKVDNIEKVVVNDASQSPAGKIEERTINTDKPSVLETLPFANRFSSGGLFSTFNSQTFNIDSAINENVPNMSIIKSAIDRTTTLDSSIFDKANITSTDELKNVQEILTRVNNMDSNNSVLLSGVLQNSNTSDLLESPSKSAESKLYCARTNDPRLNPPVEDKPKPVRRKLSISEYRKRLHKPTTPTEQPEAQLHISSASVENHPEWSSSSGGGSMSPQRLDAVVIAAQTELELRLHKELVSVTAPKATFDAQPTASERQRENLSSRLRREFGLVIPEEDHHPPPDLTDDAEPVKLCDR